MKEELIKARVSEGIKLAIADIARARGEAEAVIVREALKHYLEQHALKEQPASRSVDLSKAQSVRYTKQPIPKRKAS